MSEPASRRFFFLGAEKIRLIQLFVNLSTSVFFFPQKTKQKKDNTLLGGSTVSKFGGFTPKGIICNFMIARLLLLGFATWPVKGSSFFARPKPAVSILPKGF